MQSEDVRRKLDLSVYGSYEELYKKLGHMFGVESIEAMRNVICKDQTGETKYPGDRPFRTLNLVIVICWYSEFLKTPKTFMIPTYDTQRCAVSEACRSSLLLVFLMFKQRCCRPAKLMLSIHFRRMVAWWPWWVMESMTHRPSQLLMWA